MLLRTLIAIALFATPVTAQTLTNEEIGKIDAAVAESLAKTGTPSASIAVVRGGEIAFAKAYGKQSETLQTATVTAPYQIASVSKQFTAAALQILENQGKLSLDDKVERHIPGITGGDRITIRQLLSHTSGLQDYWPQDYSFKAMETPVRPQQIVDRWAKKPLDYEPGTKWQYSNTGYVVAGMIIEKVSGQPLMKFLQANIFKPLKMKVQDQDLATGKGDAIGYHRYALGPVRLARQPGKGWLYAAGGLSMSPSDLSLWNIARINRTLLPAEDWEAQEKPTLLADGKNSFYGLGVFARTDGSGRKAIEHGGEAVGFLTENIVFPAERIAIVVAVNADFGGAQGTIAGKIAELLIPAKPTPGVADPEAAVTARARATFDAMRSGTLDRSRMTDNWNYFYTGVVAEDYRTSLGALGTPTGFELRGAARLRGGFVNRNYVVTYADRKLVVITYAEPGDQGRYEQFLVMPVE